MTSLAERHPLPDIEDRQRLDTLFTHASLKRLDELPPEDTEEDDYSKERCGRVRIITRGTDSIDRLAYLGGTMIMAAVTDIVFRGMHGVTRKELDVSRMRFLIHQN